MRYERHEVLNPPHIIYVNFSMIGIRFVELLGYKLLQILNCMMLLK